jgi:hypothetical protein
MFGGPEVSYNQTHSARDWLSILRTPDTTQNLQRKSVDIGDNYSDHKHVSVHFLKFCFGRVVERNVTDSYSYFLYNTIRAKTSWEKKIFQE